MADIANDISSITLPSGSKHTFKDSAARLSCELLSASLLDYAQLSDISRVFIKDPSVSAYEDGKQSDLSVIKLSEEEYAQLLNLSALEPNALYIISTDQIDAYGLQIKNLSPGTELSDAVNLEQLQAVSAAVPLSTSQLENDSGFLSAHQSLSDYWTKLEISNQLSNYALTSETSSASQLSTAFGQLSNYYQKSETSSAAEISTALEHKASVTFVEWED